jgi:hypothetical protein
MKDQQYFLELMVSEYEKSMNVPLSPNDPIFHSFLAMSHVGDILSTYQDKEAPERYILTAKRRSSVIAHAIAYGYTPTFLEPDRHTQHIVFSGAIPKDVIIEEGQRVRTEVEEGSYVVAEVMETTTVPVGSTEAFIEVEVGETVEIMIGQTNESLEAYPLEGDYVYLDSLTVKVVTPMGEELWTKVDDFLNSEENDNHFTVDVGAKSFNDMMRTNDLMLYVRSGNGVNGREFPPNSTIFAKYRQVNPYTETMPLGVFVEWEDDVEYADTTTNTAVTKEKVMPEPIEYIRRNAIYMKSIGEILATKDDFEKAVIIESANQITKATATSTIDALNNKNVYTIYVAGQIYPLPVELLTETRDKLYSNYARNLNDVYELTQAPVKTGTLSVDVVYDSEMAQVDKDTKTVIIRDTLNLYIQQLTLGQTYSIPEMWRQIIDLTSSELKGLEYIQFTSTPPVVAETEELQIPVDNLTITEIAG